MREQDVQKQNGEKLQQIFRKAEGTSQRGVVEKRRGVTWGQTTESFERLRDLGFSSLYLGATEAFEQGMMYSWSGLK